MRATLSAEHSDSLLGALKAGGLPVAGVSAFSGYDAPLRWGEAIPLWFLRQVLPDSCRFVVLSHGPINTTRRAELSVARMEQTAAMGEALAVWASERCKDPNSKARAQECERASICENIDDALHVINSQTILWHTIPQR